MRRRRASSSILKVLSVLVAVVLCLGPGCVEPARAQAPTARNIVVFMVDDMELNDLPFFTNRPVQWSDPDNPRGAGAALDQAPVGAEDEPRLGEASRRLPGLNRLAARMFAVRDPGGPDDRKLGLFEPPSGDPPFRVVPGDLPSGGTNPPASEFRYTVGNAGCASTQLVRPQKFKNLCPPEAGSLDILADYGGLARLAGDGAVIFPRFYSTSAVCAPARGAFLTGRSHQRLDMPKFNSSLDSAEITIAEFLKQGCGSPGERLCVDWNASPPVLGPCPCYLDGASEDCATIDSDAACYTTGAIGKWHVGSKGDRTPWQQGFDEYVGFLGGFRKYFSRDKLTCSPDTRRYCVAGAQPGKPCLADGDCPGTGAFCDPVPGFLQPSPSGLYVGAEPSAAGTCRDASAVSDVDCCVPDQKAKAPLGRYEVAAKGFIKSKRRSMPCNADGAVKDTGCAYYTRMARDHARDFIRRHASPGGTHPFFLYVALNAIHTPKSAPQRTIAHYKRKTSTDALNTNKVLHHKFLAMTEELDAAVAGILDELKAQGVLDETLILFLTDQGQGRSSGSPDLAGGKGTVMDGGIRIGMIAYDSTLFPGAGTTATDLGEDFLGSMVDLFPTIADAAGYGDPTRFGDSTTRGIFDARGRIAKPLGLAPGNAGRRVDGRSLLPAMSQAVSGPGDARARDFVYAQYFKDTHTVVSRKGLFPNAKVCGYSAVVGVCEATGAACANDAECGTGLCKTDRVVRTVRGGSCTACSDDADCTDPAAPERCTLLGSVCLRRGSAVAQACTDPAVGAGSVCPVDELRRCVTDKDCPRLASGIKLRCVDDVPIHVACNRCFDAMWKFRATGDARKRRTRLTDLATNPEERGGELDCFVPGCNPADPVCQVQNALSARVEAWNGCVTGPVACDSEICEDTDSPAQTCPAP